MKVIRKHRHTRHTNNKHANANTKTRHIKQYKHTHTSNPRKANATQTNKTMPNIPGHIENHKYQTYTIQKYQNATSNLKKTEQKPQQTNADIQQT